MSRPSFAKIVKTVVDKFNMTRQVMGHIPNFDQVVAEEFVKEACKLYSEREALNWLRSQGIHIDDELRIIRARKEGTLNKNPERRYLPDGTYITKGVRFGEPRKLLSKEEQIVQEVLIDGAKNNKDSETKLPPTRSLIIQP